MWHTATGTRTLSGAEARLVGETAWSLTDSIRASAAYDCSADMGIPLFDHLTWQQQIVMLHRVIEPLLDPSVPPPSRSALLDATIGAIYEQMRIGVECELELAKSPAPDKWDDGDGDVDVRKRIVDAVHEHDPDATPPDPQCELLDEWRFAIDLLRDRILPDEDWLMDGLALDLPPDKSDLLKQILGIRDEYYIDVPPDADIQQARTAWADILELVTGCRPNEAVFD